MPESLIHFITSYGYLAIFGLVFLQEIGVPNPVPNELVMLFSGSLAVTGTLSFPLIFITAVSADILGTTVLYGVFYHFDPTLLRKLPLPVSQEKIARLSEQISTRGYWGIFFGRLVPFVRGYTSVAAGLLHITPRIFLPCVIASAVLWSGGYVVVGSIVGNYWVTAQSVIGKVGIVAGALFLVIVIMIVLRSRTNNHIH